MVAWRPRRDYAAQEAARDKEAAKQAAPLLVTGIVMSLLKKQLKTACCTANLRPSVMFRAHVRLAETLSIVPTRSVVEKGEGIELAITVDKTGTMPLGIQWRPDAGQMLQVISIEKGSLVDGWNQKHRNQAVKIGDRIVEVNSVSGQARQLIEECQKDQLLEMKLRRIPERQCACDVVSFSCPLWADLPKWPITFKEKKRSEGLRAFSTDVQLKLIRHAMNIWQCAWRFAQYTLRELSREVEDDLHAYHTNLRHTGSWPQCRSSCNVAEEDDTDWDLLRTTTWPRLASQAPRRSKKNRGAYVCHSDLRSQRAATWPPAASQATGRSKDIRGVGTSKRW